MSTPSVHGTRPWQRVAALLAAVALMSACLPPAEERRPVALDEYAHLTEPRALSVGVYSCNGDPEVTQLVEEDDAVYVEITSTVRNPGDACMDGIAFELDEPLGDRRLVDLTSGITITVDRSGL